MKFIKNEEGNIILFTMAALSVMTLMFILLLTFANVFIYKEKASSNAEQASLVVTGVILDELEEAIVHYDSTLVGTAEEILAKSISKKVEDESNRLGFVRPDLSPKEIKQKAINNVLRAEVGENPILAEFVRRGLEDSTREIPDAVLNNINQNNGESAGTVIKLFNDNSRVEVKTAVRFGALNFDEYFPEQKRLVKQTGQSPKFDFVENLNSWSEWSYTFPKGIYE